MDKLTKRERDVLIPALNYGWDIEFDGRGIGRWDGDTLCRFTATVALEKLIKKGLMEKFSVWETCYRVQRTKAAYEYRCVAAGCQRGRIYDEDTEIGKCQVCEGTGITLIPRSLTR